MKRNVKALILKSVCAIFVCALVITLTVVNSLTVSASEITTRDLPHYLADMNFASSADGEVAKNKNAVNGKDIVLGSDAQQCVFSSGVSLKALGEDTPAYIEISLPEENGYTLFETHYGVDYSQKSGGKSARVVLYCDGEKIESGTSTANTFQGKFTVNFKEYKSLKIEVYAEKGVCVSFGDAAFYENSANAMSKYTDNERLEPGWPAVLHRNYNFYGKHLYVGGKFIPYGFCINSNGGFDLYIDGDYEFFSSVVGIDDGVAGGSEAGSAKVKATVYAEDGSVISSAETPVVYGYMDGYIFNLYVKGGYKISFDITDGGDGIGNDSTVIGNPVFTNALPSGGVYLSDIPFDAKSGNGSVGIDKTSDGGRLEYTVNNDKLSYQKGVGLYLVDLPYSEYEKDKGNSSSYAYVKVDIGAMAPDYFEALVFAPASEGAYYEVYIDGKAVYESGLVKGFASSDKPYPHRLSVRIPDGAREFELRLIADKSSRNGRIDLVNAIFGKEGNELFTRFVESERLSENKPYPLNRNTNIYGGRVEMLISGRAKYVTGVLVSPAGASYSFDTSDITDDTFSSSVGLAKGSENSTVRFTVRVEYQSGRVEEFLSDDITSKNSGATLTYLFTEGVKTVTLSSELIEGDFAEIVWKNPTFVSSDLSDVENITDMEWTQSATGWGTIGVNKSLTGEELNINGRIYKNGISMHAFSESDKNAYVEVNVPKGSGYTVFEALIGVNKDTANGGTAGSVVFIIEGDGKELYRSDLMRATQDAEHILVDISGVSSLKLMANNGDGSYECDWANYINPKIAKSVEHLEPYITIDSIVDGQNIVLSGAEAFTVSGKLLGKGKSLDLYLNGEKVGSAERGENGDYLSGVTIKDSGENVITVKGNGAEASVSVTVSGIDNKPVDDGASFKTKTTFLSWIPTEKGMIIKSLKDENDNEWMRDNGSFISFPSLVRLGGENGREFSLKWKYEGVEYTETDIQRLDINVFGDDYNGKELSYRYTYKDESGKFTLYSVFSTESDFASPIRHKLTLENNSGDTVYVVHNDSMNLFLEREGSSRVTNSYSYKSPMYTTNYGYRCDDIKDGYNMNVFCTTDYNNGFQIDAGYIPWTSLNMTGDGVNRGLYVGIIWSDCRIEVSGIGDDIYLEAGLEEDFFTEIKDGDSYYIPEVFVGAYSGDVDDGSNEMKYWYFTHLMPECNRVDDKLPSFGYNFWEILDKERRSWRMDDSKFYDAVKELYGIGIDEITIDTYWWKDVGDWRGVHENWESTMQYSSEFVHALNMYFTIYMQAGNGPSNHTDALTTSGVFGNPNWFARTTSASWDELCLACPDALEYLKSYLANYFAEFSLDGIRTDFGYILGYCIKDGHEHIDNRVDVGYWTSLRTYELLEYMYESFPMPTDVNEGSEAHYFRWENCNCGGTLKDFMSLSYATRIQTTDAYSASEVRRSFYDSSYALPSMQLMLWFNDYMYDTTGPISDNQYRWWSILMGASCPMQAMISDMPEDMSSELVRAIEIYDTWMKELVKYGNVYHNMPRYNGIDWDGIEYYNPDTGKGAVIAFKPDPNGEVNDTYRIVFKGLEDSKTYYVWSENENIPFGVFTGAELKSGLDLTLEGSYKAEIIYFMDTEAELAEKTVSAPESFDISANEENGRLSLSVSDNKGAEYYTVEIMSGDKVVYSFTANDVYKTLVNGLVNGEYSIKITAYNHFGTTVRSKDVTLKTQNGGNSDVYTVDGDVDVYENELLGEWYKDALYSEFPNPGVTKTFTVSGITDGKYKTRIVLPYEDELESLKIEIYSKKDNTLLGMYALNGENSVRDIELSLPDGCTEISVKVTNTTPTMHIQRGTGYGRHALMSSLTYDDYSFEASVKVIRSGLNETFPRAGIFAAYQSDNCFAAFYIDDYYNNIVVYERTKGVASDKVYNYKMSDDFDYSAAHLLKVVREGKSISYYVDGTLVVKRDFVAGKSKIGIITEDAEARFTALKLDCGGALQNLTLRKRTSLVDIKGLKVAGTVASSSDFTSPKPSIIIIH